MDQILQIVLDIDATENVETAASTIVAGDMSEPLWYAISVNCGRIQINPRFGRQIKNCDLAKNDAGAIPTTKEDHNILDEASDEIGVAQSISQAQNGAST